MTKRIIMLSDYMDIVKSIGASILTLFSWIGALSTQSYITFILASILTLVTIVFVIYGIINRALDREIKKETLKDLQKPNKRS